MAKETAEQVANRQAEADAFEKKLAERAGGRGERDDALRELDQAEAVYLALLPEGWQGTARGLRLRLIEALARGETPPEFASLTEKEQISSRGALSILGDLEEVRAALWDGRPNYGVKVCLRSIASLNTSALIAAAVAKRRQSAGGKRTAKKIAAEQAAVLAEMERIRESSPKKFASPFKQAGELARRLAADQNLREQVLGDPSKHLTQGAILKRVQRARRRPTGNR